VRTSPNGIFEPVLKGTGNDVAAGNDTTYRYGCWNQISWSTARQPTGLSNLYPYEIALRGGSRACENLNPFELRHLDDSTTNSAGRPVHVQCLEVGAAGQVVKYRPRNDEV